jgi:hypothetical protein
LSPRPSKAKCRVASKEEDNPAREDQPFLKRSGIRLLCRQLAQYILQDAAMLEVLDLLRCVDAHLGVKLLCDAIG